MSRKLKLILVGTGRCATGFYAKLLTSAGVTCGHELFFSHGGLAEAEEMLANHWRGTIADSSWLAVPFLDSEPLKDALVVHLVRHPKAVIESLLRISPATTPAYDEFKAKHLPIMNKYSNPVEQAAVAWVGWNALIEQATAGREGILFNVEREPMELLDLLAEHNILDTNDVDLDNLFDNRKYNTKQGDQHFNIHLNDIGDERLRSVLVAMSQHYGYEWPKPPPPIEVVAREKTVRAVITTLDNLQNLKETIAVLKADPVISGIIVVNNGSRDGTREYLDSLITYSSAGAGSPIYTEPWVRPIHRENLGAGPGRNAGLDAADEYEHGYDYILMLDGGIRPLHGGTLRMLEYLERTREADVIGVELADFETDYETAWRRWPTPIRAYRNMRLSHTAYALCRARAWDGLRFTEEGPFSEPGWGVDDDELAYQWIEAGIVVHVVTGVHPYRRAGGSFRRLFDDTGIYPTQYGGVYEKRLCWLWQHWPQHQPGGAGVGAQWGEPWLTVIVAANGVDETAKLIKRAHNLLRQRRFKKPFHRVTNPYSVVAWTNGDAEFLEWAEPRRLRQHHGRVAIVDGEIVKRSEENEDTWTGDFRLWAEKDWESAVRPGAFYYGLVRNAGELEVLVDRYNELHPAKLSRLETPPERREIAAH